MKGTRVETLEEVWEGEPGVYFPVVDVDGEVEALWFRLPTGTVGRIAALGRGNGVESEWSITMNAAGQVTVDPSIQQEAIPADELYEGLEAWHGWLRAGVWST